LQQLHLLSENASHLRCKHNRRRSGSGSASHTLHVNLLSDGERIVHFNPEISNRTLDLRIQAAAGPRGDFRSSSRSTSPLSGEANAYRSWMDRAQSSQPIRTPGERTGASSVSVPVRGNHAEFRQKIHLSLVSKFPEPALLDQSLHFPRSRRAVQTVHQLVAFTSPCYAPK
jgi:hypothetical protein